ncbi:hypothetical protein BY996DRAFT_6518991 [Phakopsora pachyrhizi]|nr:hypothetical protein BY996DRAFT_6518991 [Phakopsora pachyrhizi]
MTCPAGKLVPTCAVVDGNKVRYSMKNKSVSSESDIGPPPSPHSVIDQNFLPITTHSQYWIDINNGFFESDPRSVKLVWCNPTTKSYGFEHPIQERSVLKKAGIPTGGVPITSTGWTNHEGMVSNQAGTSEHLARSQLRRAKEVNTTQHAKRQKANPSTTTEVTRANLNTVAMGSSGDEDDDDEDNNGKDRRGDTADTKDDKYRVYLIHQETFPQPIMLV